MPRVLVELIIHQSRFQFLYLARLLQESYNLNAMTYVNLKNIVQ